MADTLLNVELIADVWTDLYAATGIDVGMQIVVQNIGVCDVYLASQAAQPTDETKRQISARGVFLTNDFGDAGAWAICPNDGGALNVRIA